MMTIPWHMNCSHEDEGWCLSCVSEFGGEYMNLQVRNMDLNAEKDKAQDDNRALTAENKTLQDELDEAYTDLYTMRETEAKLRAELAEAALLINRYFTLEGEEQYMRWFDEISKWSGMHEERNSETV